MGEMKRCDERSFPGSYRLTKSSRALASLVILADSFAAVRRALRALDRVDGTLEGFRAKSNGAVDGESRKTR